MKLTATFVAALFYVVIQTDTVKGQSPVKVKYIIQKKDNFDHNNHETWKMRYMVNELYFKPGGPIFIYVGGENPIKESFIEWGLLTDLAKEHNGILFYTEHRQYGESKVTADLSIQNLKYLNARQALADLAHFIRTQRANDPRLSTSKVILAGCSYAGSLAVWFNRFYPELVDGTWAISAPLLAKLDFPEYLEMTGKAIQDLGTRQCYDRIQRGIRKLEQMFYGRRGKEAKQILGLCHFNQKNEEDLWTLFRAISNLFAILVTYQEPLSQNIPKMCDFLMQQKDDVTAVAQYFWQNDKSVIKGCSRLNYYGTVFYTSKITYTDIVSRPWMYQMCNEFGWFQTTTSANQPFGTKSPLILDMKHCYDIFGPEFTMERISEKIAETNKLFGGMQPNVKNLYMTYGGLDPWAVLGPHQSHYSSVVPWYGHCAHLGSKSDVDTPEMLASKERLFVLVRQWLA